MFDRNPSRGPSLRVGSPAPWVPYAIFALSGASSLAFETLWFRQATLAFGSSVWASAIVLSSFMAGIALGNGLAARHAARFAQPLRAYAFLELSVAVSGLALASALPAIAAGVGSALQPLVGPGWPVNLARLGVSFALCVVPSTAMGATLPLVVRALRDRLPSFGSTLGRLYAVNTLGAMVGAVAVEAFLLEHLGVRGSTFFVAGMALAAALGATAISRDYRSAAPPRSDTPRPLSAAARRRLFAAFLSGAILLALEVVWFRFLHLFVHGGELAFSLMLAIVLLGIGVGGGLAGAWLRRNPNVSVHAAALALGSGCVCVALFRGFEYAVAPYGLAYVYASVDILWLTFCLAFVPSLFSGALFTFVGTDLAREIEPDSRATGLLTLCNTLGAATGPFLAGFVLLPGLGMERSFYLLAAGYGVVGVALWSPPRAVGRPAARSLRWAASAAFVAAMFLFPSGLMERRYLATPIQRYGGTLEQVERIREGVRQTIVYLRGEFDGEPTHHRLITDSYSMSSTREASRRYMRLFAYLPLAIHPDAKRTLLISYGVGETAKALVETPGLERIDVVDTSREIIESSGVVHADPSEDPLTDPRVRVHIEDGRHFLASGDEGYDLITGEPPPPKIAGVVNLYTREYFQLIHDRLNEGGISSYWLPAHNLTEADSKAIVRAWCDVFADCALWSGIHLDWILTGSKNRGTAPTEEAFTRQWRAPAAGASLRRIGVDDPALLGTLFMAGPAWLNALTAETPPLVDDRPKRIGDALPPPDIAQTYAAWMDPRQTRRRFRDSEYVRRTWPARVRAQALERFDYQRMLLDTFGAAGSADPVGDLHRVLTRTPYRFLAFRLMGHDGDTVRAARALVARGRPADRYRVQLAVDALADRDFASAVRNIEQAIAMDPENAGLLFIHVYALLMTGDVERAQAIVAKANPVLDRTPEGRELLDWLEAALEIRV